MRTTSSPLDIIRAKEIEQANRVSEARRRAEQIIKDAEQQARQFILEQRHASEIEAQSRFKLQLEQIEQEAREIRKEAALQSEELKQKGSKQMANATERILKLICEQRREQEILPALSKSC